MPVRRGIRHPNLTAHDYRGGPTAIGNRGLPANILRLAPMQGKTAIFFTGRFDMPVTHRAANSGQSARAPAVASDRQQIVEKVLCFIETWLHNLKHLTRTGSPPFAPGEVSEPAGPGR